MSDEAELSEYEMTGGDEHIDPELIILSEVIEWEEAVRGDDSRNED